MKKNIKLSRSQWEEIGNKTGWLKQAVQFEYADPLIDKAVAFLQKTKGPVSKKIQFLKQKGLSDNQITAILDRVSGDKTQRSASKIKIAKQLSEEDLRDAWGGSEQDIIVNDKGEAYFAGKKICDPLPEGGPDYKAIRDWMNSNGYYPNVWSVNDHGNVEMIAIDEQGNAEYLGGLV